MVTDSYSEMLFTWSIALEMCGTIIILNMMISQFRKSSGEGPHLDLYSSDVKTSREWS